MAKFIFFVFYNGISSRYMNFIYINLQMPKNDYNLNKECKKVKGKRIMFIAPVGSVSFKNNAPVNFRARKNNDTEGQEYTPSQSRETTDLAKMPVVVLLAMTPALTEAKTPKIPEMEIMPAIEVAENKTPEADEMTYILSPITPETQQSSSYPFGYGGLRNDIVKMSHPFKSKGESCHLVFSSVKSNASNKVVEFAYVIYDNKKPNNSNSQTPPEIKKLIYHNIGKDKEFCGALIEEDIIGI